MANKPVKHAVPKHHAVPKKEEDELSINIPSKLRFTKVHWGIAAVIVALLLIIAGVSYFKGKSDNTVIATVNGEPITKADVKALRFVMSAETSKVSDFDLVNNTIIYQRLLLQEAGKVGISITQQQTESAIANLLSSQGKTRQSLDQDLSKVGVAYDQFAKLVHDELAVQAFERALLQQANITATQEEVDAYYNQHKSEIPPSMTSDQAKKAIAQGIISEKQNRLIIQLVQQIRARADIKFS